MSLVNARPPFTPMVDPLPPGRAPTPNELSDVVSPRHCAARRRPAGRVVQRIIGGIRQNVDHLASRPRPARCCCRSGSAPLSRDFDRLFHGPDLQFHIDADRLIHCQGDARLFVCHKSGVIDRNRVGSGCQIRRGKNTGRGGCDIGDDAGFLLCYGHNRLGNNRSGAVRNGARNRPRADLGIQHQQRIKLTANMKIAVFRMNIDDLPPKHLVPSRGAAGKDCVTAFYPGHEFSARSARRFWREP